MKQILHLVAISAIAASQSCGSEPEVLFQSKAYTDSDIYQGGFVVETQDEWDRFLKAFQPNNYDESLVRTSIDTSIEKVVIGSYFTVSTCYVEISDAHLECATDTNVQMKMVLNVFDASIGCDLKCEALGQVVYAVAVPSSRHIDEKSGFQINATGPCVSGSSSSPDTSSASLDPIILDTTTTTTTGATVINTQSTDELTTSHAITVSVLSASTQPSNPNVVVSTTALGATSSSIAVATESALIEDSQLHATVSNDGIILDDATLPVNKSSNLAKPDFSIEKGTTTTTTTPLPKTGATTAAIQVGDPSTILASKALIEPSNASGMTQYHSFVSSLFILLSFRAAFFL